MQEVIGTTLDEAALLIPSLRRASQTTAKSHYKMAVACDAVVAVRDVSLNGNDVKRGLTQIELFTASDYQVNHSSEAALLPRFSSWDCF
jgi:hypothetical protein